MSILTGLVIVVAMATLAQRSDTLIDFFFSEKEASIAPQNDVAALFAGDSQIIDVLGNDENAKPEDANNLHILVSPSCGAAEATAGGVLYISNDRCVGPQLFAYCVKRGDECASASVTVNVAAQVAGGVSRTSQTPVRQPVQPQAVQPQAVQPQTPQPAVVQAEPQPNRTVAATPQIRIEQPAQRIADQVANETAQTTPQREVVAALRTGQARAIAAPRLGVPVPVVDDGGQAPVTQAEAAPAAETSLFGRLFSAPSDDEAPGAVITSDAPPRVAALSNDRQWSPSQAPDVSQIFEPTPEIEIAAVTTESPLSSRERAQEEEAQSLPAAPAAAAPSRTTPAPASNAAPADATRCDVVMTTRSGQGGMSRVELQSDCYASTTFVLLHAGLEFSGRFDVDGIVSLELPVLETSDTISARLDDGAIVSAALNYDVRSVEQTRRVAIAWTAPVNLDLHAFEYSAGFGADGHVWEQNPRGFRDVRRPGGGFHSSYPAALIDGQSIEIYTFWANRRARPGFMRIAVDHASRGDVASGEFCGQGPLASPGYTVVRAEEGVITDVTRSSFAPAACGQSLSGDARYANGALADLRIAE